MPGRKQLGARQYPVKLASFFTNLLDSPATPCYRFLNFQNFLGPRLRASHLRRQAK
jgi:hypothetical protein